MRRTSLCLALPLLAACAGNPKPGEPGYPYNLSGTYQMEVVVEGTPYRGMLDLATQPGGVLGGTFQVINPVQIGGNVEGTIAADTLDFRMPYEQPNDCNGVVSGRIAVAAGGGTAGGPVVVDDSCGGAMNGTISIQR